MSPRSNDALPPATGGRSGDPSASASDDPALPRDVLAALAGSFPALVTPLTSSGAIHRDDLHRLVSRALADGAAGVLVTGTTGEGTLIGADARAEVTAIARSAIGRVGSGTVRTPPVLAGAVGTDVAGLIADVDRLAAAGADAVLVLPPAVQPLTSAELVDLHLAVADAVSVPTLAYHIPQLTGSWLDPDDLPRLFAHERVVGMKDSSPDVDRRTRFAAVTRTRDDVALLTGHAPSVGAALSAGADGSILAVANVRQRVVVALHAAAAARDAATLARRQDDLVRLTDGLRATGVSVPAALKAALQLDGAIEERWCAPPLRSVPPASLDRIRTMLLR